MRCSAVGEELATALSAFSLDIVGIVAGYAVFGVARAHAKPLVLTKFDIRLQASLSPGCYSIAVSPDGKQIWASAGKKLIVYNAEGQHQFTITRVQSFSDPSGCLAIDSDGSVFVSSFLHSVVFVLQADGSFVRSISSNGSAPGKIDCPRGIAFHNDRLLVTDGVNERISIFNKHSGEFVRLWKPSKWPSHVAVSPAGEVFVSVPREDCVQVCFLLLVPGLILVFVCLLGV